MNIGLLMSTELLKGHVIIKQKNKKLFIHSTQVMYGGRVIDDFDRRIVQTYMDEYMGDFLFDASQPFHFYHNEHVDYAIPEAISRQEFIGEKKFI